MYIKLTCFMLEINFAHSADVSPDRGALVTMSQNFALDADVCSFLIVGATTGVLSVIFFTSLYQIIFIIFIVIIIILY